MANWDDAMMYCQFLTVDGKTNWRLPTKDELDLIYKSKNDFVKTYYWSSTEGNGSNAWLQGLSSGFRGSYNLKRNRYYVCAVRDIK